MTLTIIGLEKLEINLAGQYLVVEKAKVELSIPFR